MMKRRGGRVKSLQRNRKGASSRRRQQQQDGTLGNVCNYILLATLFTVAYLYLFKGGRSSGGSGNVASNTATAAQPKTPAPAPAPADKAAARGSIRGTEGASSISKQMPAATKSSILTMPSCEGKTTFGDPAIWEAFAETIKWLDKLNVHYWVSAGTLLGFARNCSHIDYDIDISIDLAWLTDQKEMVMSTNIVSDARFEHNRNYRGIDGTPLSEGGEKNFFYSNPGDTNKIKIDMFHSLRSPNFFKNGFSTERGLYSCPRPMQGLQKFQWGDLTIPVPMPYADVLRATYGDDYLSPKSNGARHDALLWRLTKGGCQVIRRTQMVEARLGLVACVMDDKAGAQALALVENLKAWEVMPELALELYHSGALSMDMRTKLEQSSPRNVKIVNLNEAQNGHPELGNKLLSTNDPLAQCHADALEATALEHIILVRSSIVFLRNPLHFAYTAQNIHEGDHDGNECAKDCRGASSCCRGRSSCVTTTDEDIRLPLEERGGGKNSEHRVCMIRTHQNTATYQLIYQEEEVAAIHSSAHGSSNWAYPNGNYGRGSVDQESPFAVKMAEDGTMPKLPKEYLPFLKSHWNAYSSVLADTNS